MSIEQLVEKIEDNQLLLKLLSKMKKIEINQDLFSLTKDKLTSQEVKFLIEAGNILAASSRNESKKKALNIATTLPCINNSKGVLMSAISILRKLGNFPAINLLEEKYQMSDYKKLLSGLSSFEAYLKESLNTQSFFGKDYVLTDFQKKVSHMVHKSKAVSVSAPTSAGKSFIYTKILLALISEKRGSTAVYVVPTRALIRQVMDDFMQSVGQFKLENMYIGCSSEVEILWKNNGKSNVLVLTQERLYQLCTRKDVKKLNVKLIVIDEAHNIESNGRGVLLESSVKFAQSLWPNARILFSSPLVSNPERLLTLFNLEYTDSEKDIFPLVRQNIITVEKKSNNLVLSTDFEGEQIEIITLPYENKSKAKDKVLSSVASKLWNGHTSIIYADGPVTSSNIARELFNSEEFPSLNDDKLNEFADFIDEYISDKYELSDFIRCGIAFHFGALPPIIRAGIEDLFKAGSLKIVCCTSTLLEGVNMPAKNIFMYKPKKGSDPVNKLSFWNLAGRAGRMGSDFAGNIICIEPKSWDEKPFEGEVLQPIIPSSERRLITVDESEKLKDYMLDISKVSGVDDYNEQLVTMIIKDSLVGNKLVNSQYKNEQNENTLMEIDSIAEIIINNFLPPKELLNINPGVIPERINKLWLFFMDKRSNYKEILPLFPSGDEGYQRFREIIHHINNIFMDKKWTDKTVEKITVVGWKWMRGMPLSQIVFYQKAILSKLPKEITKHVKNQIDFLNKEVRYEIVKYTKVYIEVLRVYLEVIGIEEEANKLINISSYLEYGACSLPALEFMAIGLPREAAVKLAENYSVRKLTTSQQYLKWIKGLDLSTLEISPYLKRQILKVQST